MPAAVMHARNLTGGLIAVALCLTVGFVACRRPSEPSRPTALGPRSTVPTASLAWTPGVPAAQPAASVTEASPDAGPAPVDPAATAISRARACGAPLSVIANQPDGGTVFNNAMTAADAGHIDRTAGVLEAIAGQSVAMRCCFDVWGGEHPTKEGRLLLRLTLASDGTVQTAEVDATRTDIVDPITVRCVLEVARSTSYPVSPTGKETIVEYPFVVQPGRDTNVAPTATP